MTDPSPAPPADVPSHLGTSGAAFYGSAVAEFDLSIPEEAALLQAAETLDVLRTIEDRIRLDGPITSAGRPSPLLGEARQQRATLVRLLGLMDLRLDESGERPTLSASRAASKAASIRWQRARSGEARFHG